MFCSKCGFKLEGDEKFCPKCGTKKRKIKEDVGSKEETFDNEFTQTIPKVNLNKLQEEKCEDYNHLGKNYLKYFKNKKIVLVGTTIVLFSVLIFFLAYNFLGNKKPDNKNSKNYLATVSNKNSNSMKIIDINIDNFPIINLKVKFSSNFSMKGVNEKDITIVEKGIKQKVKGISLNTGEENVHLITYKTNDETFNEKSRLVELSLNNNKIEYSANISYQIPKPANVKLGINQIDSSNFPEISVYFTAEDNNGEVLKALNKEQITIKESKSTNSLEEEILDLKQMNLQEALNINLVMDTSGSMSGNKVDTAKDAALTFLNSVQFNSGDLVGLITFNDIVSVDQSFTNEKNSIEKALIGLSTDGETAFYDSLNTALVETSRQAGPKCIIAFTDGLDNKSIVTPEYVIDLAKKLGIPIYIIGIGDDFDTSILQNISKETRGYFTHTNNIEELQQIYNSIFKEQKEQYVLRYKTKNKVRDGAFRNIDLELKGAKYIGNVSSSYLPKYAIDPSVNPSTGYSSQYGMTDIEKAMYDYQHNFVEAVNTYDFSNLSEYIDSNGPLYNKQKNLIDSYKKQEIQEKLIFYAIESTKKINDNEYQLVVYEKFYITYGTKMPALMEYRNIYTIKNTSKGLKVSDMPDLKILNNISVNYNSF